MTDSVEERIALPVGEVALTRPRDSEALLTEEGFEKEEFLPYWAELWSSGVALAHDVAGRSLRGASVVELGCGLGLPSIAAALAGGRVLATDWSPAAIAFAERNAQANGAQMETAVVSWADPDELSARGPWDLVIGSDLLYEARNVGLVLDVLDRVADHAIIADPGRAASVGFEDAAAGHWDVRSDIDDGPPRIVLFELRRA